MLSENIFWQNFCPPIFVTQSFAPNIYDKLAPLHVLQTAKEIELMRFVGLLYFFYHRRGLLKSCEIGSKRIKDALFKFKDQKESLTTISDLSYMKQLSVGSVHGRIWGDWIWIRAWAYFGGLNMNSCMGVFGDWIWIRAWAYLGDWIWIRACAYLGEWIRIRCCHNGLKCLYI